VTTKEQEKNHDDDEWDQERRLRGTRQTQEKYITGQQEEQNEHQQGGEEAGEAVGTRQQGKEQGT
jgi:hypothetical protein